MTHIDQVATAASSSRFLNLQRANDFKSALLGMAGHDLRQPLQVIQNSYDWFELNAATPSEKARVKRGERALARITEQLDRLIGALHLHDNMRDIEVAPVALSPLLLRLTTDSQDQVELKDIELRVCPSSVTVMTNPALLDGILRNLVQNAIKFTQPGGRVLIGCRRYGSLARIDVIDTGIGIPIEHMQRIFMAFERVNSIQTDGLGMGLYVARRAAELLGHDMEARSTVARGSRFSVTIPTCEPASPNTGSSGRLLN